MRGCVWRITSSTIINKLEFSGGAAIRVLNMLSAWSYRSQGAPRHGS